MKTQIQTILVRAALAVTLSLPNLPVSSAHASDWSLTGSMQVARYSSTATLLNNGSVLVAGGFTPAGVTNEAELYNPTNGVWAVTGSMSAPRYFYTATLLNNGKVLVAGGFHFDSNLEAYVPTNSTELYDPASGTWTNTGHLNTARGDHTATLLANGKVMVCGGDSGGGGFSSTEVYDPASGTWSVSGPLNVARQGHTATLLGNGKVLVTGGKDADLNITNSVELYDPTAGTWSVANPMESPRYKHTATLLKSGWVLVAAGESNGVVLASSEIYIPSTGAWTSVGSLNNAREFHVASLLPNKQVLVVGGVNGTGDLADAEIFDPIAGTWTETDPMSTPRVDSTATLLANGQVLVAGGNNTSGYLASAELFALPVVINGPYAGPGNLDLTFAGSGLSRVGFTGGEQFGNAVAVQPDGKLVLAGAATTGNLFDEFEIVRFDTNYVLDVTFGTGGAVFTPFNPVAIFAEGASALAVAIQADGKIVAGGSADSDSYSDFALARYNPDGSLDASFGSGGEVLTDFGTSSGISVLQIEADGKIVAAGSSGGNFALARYDTNGLLDASFGSGGTVTANVGGLGDAKALLIDPTGRYFTAGAGGGGSDFAVACYTTTGVLDTTFGGTGIVLTAIPGYVQNFATAIGYQFGVGPPFQIPSKLVVAGNGVNGAPGNVYAIVRYNLDGTLDTNFNGTGILKDSFVSSDFASVSGILVQGAGLGTRTITVTGTGSSTTASYFGLARYTGTGALDTTFGSGTGKTTLSFGPQHNDVASALTVPSGKLLLGGYSWISMTQPENVAFAAAQFNSNGSLDTSFGNNGVVTADVCGNGGAQGVGIQPDGKIVVVGGSFRPIELFGLMRYNSDGSLDSSFGSNARVTTQVGTTNAAANAVAIQPDGKIVAAGWAGPSINSSLFAVARYTPNGALDAAFGSAGQVITTVGGQNDVINAVALQSDGKIVVAGSTVIFPLTQFAVARYETNGTLDSTFNGTGKVTTSVIGPNNCVARSVQIQPDGKIVAAGYTTGATTNFALVRYNTDGSLDNLFGSFGKVSTTFGSAAIAEGYGLALQADGKLVLAGQLITGGIGYVAIARYNTDGTLDNSFGTGGKMSTEVGLSDDYAVSVAVLPNGKIVAGALSTQGVLSKYAAVRVNADGSLDSSYGIGGKVLVDFEDGYDSPTALALDQIGRAVLVGSANGLFGVARLASEPFLKITSINAFSDEGPVTLHGVGFPLANHTLLISPTLGSGPFSPLDTVTTDAGGLWEYQDTTTAGVNTRFYRLSHP